MSKSEFLDALIKEGFNASFANSGVPTIFVRASEEISKANKAIRRLIKEYGYNQSYGISLSPAEQN